ncbi:30259_t:CDS:2 [Gigaspora margarita]|uniref:30259_t:CDS:1 n=1 Tax=Gigaspora margarita TaxID=4874 RepID=A0ABN7UKA0_GIGMA|nr:30259_t:CDS:2 [Gigaspora margarita]
MYPKKDVKHMFAVFPLDWSPRLDNFSLRIIPDKSCPYPWVRRGGKFGYIKLIKYAFFIHYEIEIIEDIKK